MLPVNLEPYPQMHAFSYAW